MGRVRDLDEAARELVTTPDRLRLAMINSGMACSRVRGIEVVDEEDFARLAGILSRGRVPHTLEELAAVHGTSPRTLQRHVKEGRLEAERRGRRYLVTENAWRDFLRRGPDDLWPAFELAGLKEWVIGWLDPLTEGPTVTLANVDRETVLVETSGAAKAFVYPASSWRDGSGAAACFRDQLGGESPPLVEALLLPASALTSGAYATLRALLLKKATVIGAVEIEIRIPGPARAAVLVVATRAAARSPEAVAAVGRLRDDDDLDAFAAAVGGAFRPSGRSAEIPSGRSVVIVGLGDLNGRLDFDYHDPENDPRSLFPAETEWRRLGDIVERAEYGVWASAKRDGRETPDAPRYLTWADLSQGGAPGKGQDRAAGAPAAWQAGGKGFVWPGDVVVNPILTKTASARAVTLQPDPRQMPAVISNPLILLRLRADASPSAADVAALINGDVGRRWFEKTALGPTCRRVSLEDLLEMPVPLRDSG